MDKSMEVTKFLKMLLEEWRKDRKYSLEYFIECLIKTYEEE